MCVCVGVSIHVSSHFVCVSFLSSACHACLDLPLLATLLL